MKLRDKVAIITGSRRGIGRAIAHEMAKEGAKIVISDIDLKECEGVVREIKALGSHAIAVKCDVTKKSDVDNMFRTALKKFGKVDILVNNAGVYVAKPFDQMEEKDWDFVMDVNVKGMFLCTRAVVGHMMRRKTGKIISTASIAGMIGFANSSAYCASKGAIINMTKELALELGPYNINVNAIAPGIIETKMTEAMLQDKKAKKGLLQSTPLNRIGKPHDIGKLAVFLASDDAHFITGHTVVIDGGWTAR